MRRIVVIDTSILCVWLRIPNKDTCGPDGDRWDYKRIMQLIEKENADRSMFVLPVATLIETGNHISQAPHKRFDLAVELMQIVRKTLSEEEPWQRSRTMRPHGVSACGSAS